MLTILHWRANARAEYNMINIELVIAKGKKKHIKVMCNKRLFWILRDTRWFWAESRLCEFWNILLSRSCRNEKIVMLPSDYKSMFFKLSADAKFMPINLDLEPNFGDFVPPIRQVSVQGFLAIFRDISLLPQVLYSTRFNTLFITALSRWRHNAISLTSVCGRSNLMAEGLYRIFGAKESFLASKCFIWNVFLLSVLLLSYICIFIRIHIHRRGFLKENFAPERVHHKSNFIHVGLWKSYSFNPVLPSLWEF